MVLLMNIGCPACRVERPVGTCGHRKFAPLYVKKFSGTATVLTAILDDAKTFKTVKEAEAFYNEAKKKGVKSTTLRPVIIG